MITDASAGVKPRRLLYLCGSRLMRLGGKKMTNGGKKSILLQVYLYLVCLIAIIFVIIWASMGLWGLVKVVVPQFTIQSYELRSYLSYDEFVRTGGGGPRGAPPTVAAPEGGKAAEPAKPTREDWQEYRKSIVTAQRYNGFQDFAQGIIWLIVVVPVLIFHWRNAKRLRESEG